MAERFVTMEHTLRVLLEEKKYSTLKDVLVTMNGADVAAVFQELSADGIPKLFRLLPKVHADDFHGIRHVARQMIAEHEFAVFRHVSGIDQKIQQERDRDEQRKRERKKPNKHPKNHR